MEGPSSKVLNNGELPENCPAVSIAKKHEKRHVSYGDPESILRLKAMSFKNMPSIIRKRGSWSSQKATIISAAAAAATNHGGDDFPAPTTADTLTGG